ncbi:UFM1 specific peptidase 2 [Augochlora pura]
MAPQLRILSNVLERLKNIDENVTGYLYGIMYNNTLTVLTFSINIENDTDANINHTILQLHMPAEIYLCGVLHVGECEKKLPDTFQDIDITDNPLFLKYSNQNAKIEVYFYIHQKLEAVNSVSIIHENDIQKEFMYIRLRGNLPLIAQNGNIMEILDELRINIASGKIGIHFPLKNTFLLNTEPNSKDTSLKELIDVPVNCQESPNAKKNSMQLTGVVDVTDANILLKLSGDRFSEERTKYAPVLQYMKRQFSSFECNLPIDTLSLVNVNVSSADLHGILVESMCRNIKLIEKCFDNQLKQPEQSTKLPISIHFKPQALGHLFTVIYPKGNTDKETVAYREVLHKTLALEMTRPYFCYGNAVRFSSTVQADDVLINPHEAIPQNNDLLNTSTRNVGIVQGLYAYHHYMQDNFNDNGWGCAYRSLQTIISWYRLQGYTEIPIPSHHTIQKCLFDIGDKPSNFIDSKQWIGSTEVGFVLESLLGISVKILCASTGEEVSQLASDLIHHFQTQATPVMIGGGVLAHTILGVSCDESNGDVKFLILDPHYTGTENLSTIISKGWCGWKNKDFWKKNAFYNICLPQRPLCI